MQNSVHEQYGMVWVGSCIKTLILMTRKRCVKDVSRLCQGCVKDVSRMCQGCVKEKVWFGLVWFGLVWFGLVSQFGFKEDQKEIIPKTNEDHH